MKIAIMQPYFFPYIGYFQLINAVDTFIVLDDVNFIKKGWINRNRILVNGEAHMVAVPIKNMSQNRMIKNTQIADYNEWRSSFLKTIQHAYANAPFFKKVFPLLEKLCATGAEDLTVFLVKIISAVCTYLEIKTSIKRNSRKASFNQLVGEERILSLCKEYEADTYINAPGGRKLYDANRFESFGICLLYLMPEKITYSQGGDAFVPNLSILDVLMFNAVAEVRGYLSAYSFTS